jgi:hypothetical protein
MVLDRRVDATGRKPSIRVYLEEGNFTYSATLDTIYGEAPGGSFAARVGKNTEVQIYTGADRTVQVLSTGTSIGVTRTQPKGTLPRANKTSGNYPRRQATLDLYGELEWVPLAADNAAISPGDHLALADAQHYEKEEDAPTTSTNLRAFESRDASQGGSILAIRLGNGAQFEAD